jgi:hypothetical protein
MLRFDRLVARYAVAVLLVTSPISFVYYLLYVAISEFGDPSSQTQLVIVTATVLAIALAVCVSSRLWQMLSHVAIESIAARRFEGWHTSRAIVWNLWVGWLLVSALATAGIMAFPTLDGIFGPSAGPLAIAAVNTGRQLRSHSC